MTDERRMVDEQEQLYKRRKLSIMIGSNVHAISMGVDYENTNPVITLSWRCPKCGDRMERSFGIFDTECENE